MPTDVVRLIDEGRFSAYQQLLVAATALLIILDGADNQLLANAIPAMMREWDLPRAAFASLKICPASEAIGTGVDVAWATSATVSRSLSIVAM